MWTMGIRLTRFGVTLYLAVLLEGILLIGSCPSPDCVCKWKGGKQWVECVSKNLRTFPPSIDSGSQVLDMSGNSFETLPPDHFMRSGLINLQKIFLSKCRLSHVNSRAFRGLSNLVELDLGSNLLRDVPSPAFPDTPGLMRLVLSGNPISVLGKRAFVPLEALTTLELSSTGLELIEGGAFEGLHSLEWLKLDGNRLKGVKGLSILPLGLKGLSLEDNPWECDCHLLELRLWLGERNVAAQTQPRCSGPDRVTNSTIKSLPPEAFACQPQLSPTTMFQKIGEGRNVSLLCKVLSVPESSLEWLFNGLPLTNASLNLLVETSSSYVPSLGTFSTSTAPSLTTPVEKKSELLILNATSEENGTFLCLARNPAGVASANFTLRVLSDTGGSLDLSSGDLSSFGLPQLVTNYPNLFIIGLSTVAVIGLLLILGTFSFLLCQCSRCCGRRRGGSTQNGSLYSTATPGKGVTGGVPGKLDRNGINLSDASTLTTNTKKSSSNTNGSVFLLSSSSVGDSNPDLIEGVALNASLRGDGDGLDSNIYNSTINPQGYEPGYYGTQQRLLSPCFHSEGGQGTQRGWPVDYGLPYSTPPPPPAGYDLSKYPKEYLSQAPQGPYEYTVSPVLYSDYPPAFYPYQGPGYSPGYSTVPPGPPSSNPNCSCGPILEGNETEEQEPAPTKTVSTSPSPPERLNPNPGASLGDSRVKIGVASKKGADSSPRAAVLAAQQINESPDEGYEDGGAEGTEI